MDRQRHDKLRVRAWPEAHRRDSSELLISLSVSNIPYMVFYVRAHFSIERGRPTELTLVVEAPGRIILVLLASILVRRLSENVLIHIVRKQLDRIREYSVICRARPLLFDRLCVAKHRSCEIRSVHDLLSQWRVA